MQIRNVATIAPGRTGPPGWVRLPGCIRSLHRFVTPGDNGVLVNIEQPRRLRLPLEPISMLARLTGQDPYSTALDQGDLKLARRTQQTATQLVVDVFDVLLKCLQPSLLHQWLSDSFLQRYTIPHHVWVTDIICEHIGREVRISLRDGCLFECYTTLSWISGCL